MHTENHTTLLYNQIRVTLPIMPHPDGDAVLNAQTITQSIHPDYEGAHIAVHAGYFLHKFITSPPYQEPLHPVLGGNPFALKTHLEVELQAWQKLDLHPTFYFDGEGFVESEEIAMRESKVAYSKMEGAWKLYHNQQPNEAVIAFGKSGAAKPYHLYRFFQEILIQQGIPFEVAPYSACAQMAYMDRQDVDTVLGIMGPPELLLYSIDDCIITGVDVETKQVSGLHKSQILNKLNINEETFIDAFLMTGTSSLPPFPPLMDEGIVRQQPYTIQDAVNMLRTANKSIALLCEQWSDLIQKTEPKWLDMYQRTRMAIKHAITISLDGHLEVAKFEELTQDHHEYIGLQLAPELYFYQQVGLISPRVLSWFSHLKMFVHAPLEGGLLADHQVLVSKTLIPIQEQTISLGASKMHRAFQHKNVEKKFWNDPSKTVVLAHRDVSPSPADQAASWHVNEAIMKKYDNISGEVGSIAYALNALTDSSFRAETLVKPSKETPLLKTKEEIKANTLWRFLHMRGYINKDHELTNWGSALQKSVAKVTAIEQEEAALLAYELIRHNALHAELPEGGTLGGGPYMGTPEHNKLNLLISRTACLLPLRHKKIGYTGPLSQNLLQYHSIASAVREAERDLTEVIAVNMFVSNQAERKEREDWRELGAILPFGHDNSTALAIAVKHWFDEQQEKEKYVNWPISYAEDSLEDLKLAFRFFDALMVGLKELSEKEVKDLKVWKDAEKYLETRRF